MLLLHPPASKPCEAPAGLARLIGALRGAGVSSEAADLNLAAIGSLLKAPEKLPEDTWTRRAFKNRDRSLALLRSGAGYENADRYARAAEDLNRLLAVRTGTAGAAGTETGKARLTLGDYEEKDRSPLKSSDLVETFRKPETSPLFPYFAPHLAELLEDANCREVGLSLSFLSQALPAFALAGFVRRFSPQTKLILGGSLTTSWLRLPEFRNPFAGTFDRCIEGPGELPLLEFAGKSAGAGAAAGTEEAPDYSDFKDLPYLAPGFILPYAASSGCAWKKCAFCPEKAENSPYRPVPPARVLRELGELVEQTAPVLLHFLDSELSPALLRALAAKPPGVPWYGFARVSEVLEDAEFCRALRGAGCVMLKLGIESGDQSVLDAMRKGTTVEGGSRILKNLSAAGIGTFVYLLFGTPAEGPEEAERTLDFAVRHAGEIDFFNLAIFNLPRSSDLAAGLRTTPFYEGDLSLYSGFAHPRGWNRGEVRAFLDGRFRKHPALAPILRRLPPHFASNHAPFFTKAYKEFRKR